MEGFERMKASAAQVVAFVEWMADQPCRGNGSGKLCRVNSPHDLEWCCPFCRAHLLRYGINHGKENVMLMTGIYKHYKGGYYQVLGIGAHSETDERLVAYVSVLPAPGTPHLPGPRMRLRPVHMWDELVTWPDGTTGPRFKYVGQEIPAPAVSSKPLPEGIEG
jgi:hypothetical protein